MDEQEMLKEMAHKGYLNFDGMNRYIGYLEGMVHDLQPKITEALSKGEPKRKKNIGVSKTKIRFTQTSKDVKE